MKENNEILLVCWSDMDKTTIVIRIDNYNPDIQYRLRMQNGFFMTQIGSNIYQYTNAKEETTYTITCEAKIDDEWVKIKTLDFLFILPVKDNENITSTDHKTGLLSEGIDDRRPKKQVNKQSHARAISKATRLNKTVGIENIRVEKNSTNGTYILFDAFVDYGDNARAPEGETMQVYMGSKYATSVESISYDIWTNVADIGGISLFTFYDCTYYCDSKASGEYFTLGVQFRFNNIYYDDPTYETVEDDVYIPENFGTIERAFIIGQSPTMQTQYIKYDGDTSIRGEANCCVANAVASAVQVGLLRRGIKEKNQLSIGWFYGATGNEAGTEYARAFNFLKTYGARIFSITLKYRKTTKYPDVYAYNDAYNFYNQNPIGDGKLTQPQRIASWSKLTGVNWDQSFGWQKVLDAIRNQDKIVLAALKLDKNFFELENDTTGIYKDCSNETKDGAELFHMMIVLGWKTLYDGTSNRLFWICQNSWGANWGDNGICYVPFSNTRVGYGWFGIQDFYELTIDRNAPLLKEVEPWDWNKSNGSFGNNGKATATQTKAAYSAITNKTATINFPYLVWNDLVDKVSEAVIVGKGKAWDSTYGTQADARMTSSDKTLTAKRFNILVQNIDGFNTLVKTGDPVYGRYFTEMTTALNKMIG